MAPSNLMRNTRFTALIALSLGVAGYAVFVYGFLPLGVALHPDMGRTFQAHRTGIYTHVFASVVALTLGPLQFVARLRDRHRVLRSSWLIRSSPGSAGCPISWWPSGFSIGRKNSRFNAEPLAAEPHVRSGGLRTMPRSTPTASAACTTRKPHEFNRSRRLSDRPADA
jgi:hypothetical protein